MKNNLQLCPACYTRNKFDGDMCVRCERERVICQYCDKPAEWVENKEIYGRNYGKSYMMYWCRPCDAYVGCHNNTRKPKGTLANKELRGWRKKAHAHVDPLWQSGQLARGQVYYRLKKALGKEIHIGESDIEMCKRILDLDITNSTSQR